MPPSSSGLGHCPFTAAARVRIPLGVPRPCGAVGERAALSRRRSRVQVPSGSPDVIVLLRPGSSVGMSVRLKSGRSPVRSRPWPLLHRQLFSYGPVAQLVSAPPCHGGGRGFKSRQGRQQVKPPTAGRGFLLCPLPDDGPSRCSVRSPRQVRYPVHSSATPSLHGGESS